MGGNWNSGRKPAKRQEMGEYKPPVKPQDMDRAQVWLWDTVIVRMIEQQVVERGDEDGLQMMLRSWSAFQAAMDSGDIAEAMKSGDFYRKLKSLYGANRSMRSKVGVPTKQDTGIRARERK